MYYTGIDLLKIALSFLVVCCHFYGGSNVVLVRIMPIAVPAFMFLQFFLSADIFLKSNSELIKKRILRLCVPLWVWGSIYCLVFGFRIIMNWEELFFQLILGCSKYINPTLWFLSISIIITLLFYFLFILNKKYPLRILIFLILFCFVLQYSNMNYIIFCDLDYTVKYSFGRLCEMIPYAGGGIILGYRKCDCKKHILLFYTTLLILMQLCNKFDINGFGYEGFSLFASTLIICSIAIFCPQITSNIIRKISKYTLGIYCTHFGVGKILSIFLNCEIKDCLMIWIVCFVIVIAISKLPINTKFIV